MIPITTPFKSFISPVQKMAISWRIAVDYYKHDEVASSCSHSRYGCLTGANTEPVTLTLELFRWQVLFKNSVPIRRQSLLSPGKDCSTLYCFSFLSPCHSLSTEIFNHLLPYKASG